MTAYIDVWYGMVWYGMVWLIERRYANMCILLFGLQSKKWSGGGGSDWMDTP